MYGILAKGIEHFIRFQHSDEIWSCAARQVGLDARGVEAMQRYANGLPQNLVCALSVQIDRSEHEIWEDLGTHFVTHSDMQIARRLLRFGGASFEDFLWSIEDFPEQMSMALPDLELPEFELRDEGRGNFRLQVHWPDLGPVGNGQAFVLGLLRALADDFGALVVLDGGAGDEACIAISLLDTEFADGNMFSLTQERSA